MYNYSQYYQIFITLIPTCVHQVYEPMTSVYYYPWADLFRMFTPSGQPVAVTARSKA